MQAGQLSTHLCSIALLLLAYLLTFRFEDLPSPLSEASPVRGSGRYSKLEASAIVAGGSFSMNSSQYLVRCTSVLSVCNPEYFLLSDSGEMIHGLGPSPGESDRVIWRSKNKGYGKYFLNYEANKFVTITRMGVLPNITELFHPKLAHEVDHNEAELVAEASQGSGDGVCRGDFISKLCTGMSKVATKLGILKDKTKNRRVLRKRIDKLPNLAPWPFL